MRNSGGTTPVWKGRAGIQNEGVKFNSQHSDSPSAVLKAIVAGIQQFFFFTKHLRWHRI